MKFRAFLSFMSPQIDHVAEAPETANLIGRVKEWVLLHVCVMDQMTIDLTSY